MTETMRRDGCTCDQFTDPAANPICDACQQVHAEVVQELYETNPEFRAEMDRWVSVDSPEGQHILAAFDGGE